MPSNCFDRGLSGSEQYSCGLERQPSRAPRKSLILRSRHGTSLDEPGRVDRALAPEVRRQDRRRRVLQVAVPILQVLLEMVIMTSIASSQVCSWWRNCGCCPSPRTCGSCRPKRYTASDHRPERAPRAKARGLPRSGAIRSCSLCRARGRRPNASTPRLQPRGRRASSRASSSSRVSHMILIVDDDRSVTASLALLLKQAGLASTAAGSPEEALDVLLRQPCQLIIQDMNFSRRTSGEEGLALLRQIKDATPSIPVILITARGSIALAVEGMKAGAVPPDRERRGDDGRARLVSTPCQRASARTKPPLDHIGGATRCDRLDSVARRSGGAHRARSTFSIASAAV